MNSHLVRLHRACDLNAEKTMFTLHVVLAYDTELTSSRERRAYGRLHPNTAMCARDVIRDFTSTTGLFNVDHPAWQLGLDTTGRGPMIADDDGTHVCVEERLIYLGHYVTPGRGSSHRCSTCFKIWSKIGDQYAEAEVPVDTSVRTV